MEEIPIVDLNNIHEESEGSSTNPDWIKAAEKIRKGLGSVGFLYLVNHGIPEHVVNIFTILLIHINTVVIQQYHIFH